MKKLIVMKKFLFCMVFFVAAIQLSAQQTNIVNPGFEQWNAGLPVGWSTSFSGLVGSTPVEFNFGIQTTDAHSGNYALKIKAVDPEYGFPLFPGVAQLGSAGSFAISTETYNLLTLIDFNDPSWNNFFDYTWDEISFALDVLGLSELGTMRNVFSKGEAFNKVPTAMKVWVKYLPPVGEVDTMRIMVGAYKAGEDCALMMGNNYPSSYGSIMVSDRMEEYTELTVPIDYDTNDVNCDSLMILFFASPFMNANLNTELYIDDISFEFDYVSVESAERVKMQLYPNPASEYLTVSVEKQSESYDISVYDLNGKLVKQQMRLMGQSRLYVGDLSAGAYFLKVRQAGNETARKFVVE